MKNKLVIALLTTALLLSACGGKQADAQPEINIGTETNNEQGEVKELTWIQLYDLDTYNDTLRVPMEHAANTGYYINPETKEGTFYHDQYTNREIVKNNTLAAVLHSEYGPSGAFSRPETIKAFSEAACNTYADLDAEDEMTNYYMAINGYFNLLPDAEPNYCNADSLITRGEFLAAVFRAENKVDENLELDEEFASAVGDSEYAMYAQSLAKYGYLTTEDSSLNSKTFNGAISKGEAIYFIMNYSNSHNMSEFEITDETLEDVSDGGDIATELGFTEKEYGKSYELAYMLENPTEVPTDMYKALIVANQKGFIEAETRWEEGLTKAEAIELIVKMHTTRGLISTEKLNETPEVPNNATSDNKPTPPSLVDDPSLITYVDLTEDTDGDGIISWNEDLSDNIPGYTVYKNNDGSNTTYMVDYETGEIIHPGDKFINKNTGEQETWFGTTPEDSDIAWND